LTDHYRPIFVGDDHEQEGLVADKVFHHLFIGQLAIRVTWESEFGAFWDQSHFK
jgi:hypothetical protein